MTRQRHDSVVEATPWAGIHRVETHSARAFPRHWHDGYGLGLMEDGAHRSASGCGQVEAYAGDVITSNPGEIHDGRPLGTSMRRWRMLCIETSAMPVVSVRDDDRPAHQAEIIRPVIRDAHLARSVARLFRRLDRWKARLDREDAGSLACEETLIEACSFLLGGHTATPRGSSAAASIQRIRERLGDDVMHPPSLDELAAISGLSKFQVVRHFQRAYGLAPHAWLLHLRAERARSLIRDGASLGAAAAQSGFADQSHMTRVFVRHFGFTPGAWRRAASRPVQ